MVKNEKIEKLLAECEVLFDSKRKNKARAIYNNNILGIVSYMDNYTEHNWNKLSDIFNYNNLCVDLYYSYKLAKYIYADNIDIQINSICNDIIKTIEVYTSIKNDLKSSINDFAKNFSQKILSLVGDDEFNYNYSDFEINILRDKCDPIVKYIGNDGYIINPNKKKNQITNNSQKNVPLIEMDNYNQYPIQKQEASKVEQVIVQPVQEQNKSSLIAKDTDDFTNTAKTVIDYLNENPEKESFLCLIGVASLKDKNIITAIKQNKFITDIISEYVGDDFVKSIRDLELAVKCGILEEMIQSKTKVTVNNLDESKNLLVDSFIKLIYSLDKEEYIKTFVLLLLQAKNQYSYKDNDNTIIDHNDTKVEEVKTEQSVQQPESKVEQQVQQPQWTNPITPEEEEMIKKAKVVKQQDQQKQQPVQQEQKEPESYSLMDAINSTTLGRKLFQKIDNVAI